MKLVCWPDAELIFQRNLYFLVEKESGDIFCQFHADNQVDGICIGASKYGVYSTIKALNQQVNKVKQLH